jgi:hypothetical protein
MASKVQQIDQLKVNMRHYSAVIMNERTCVLLQASHSESDGREGAMMQTMTLDGTSAVLQGFLQSVWKQIQAVFSDFVS